MPHFDFTDTPNTPDNPNDNNTSNTTDDNDDGTSVRFTVVQSDAPDGVGD